MSGLGALAIPYSMQSICIRELEEHHDVAIRCIRRTKILHTSDPGRAVERIDRSAAAVSRRKGLVQVDHTAAATTGWEAPRTDNVDGVERLSTGSAREVTDDAQSFVLIADVEDTGVNQLPLTEQSNSSGAGALTTKETAALLTTSADSSR